MTTTESTESLSADPEHPDSREEESSQQASFESATKWPEEEARFTPIDLEAFPAEESATKPHSDTVDAGFAISSLVDEGDRGAHAQATGATSSEQSSNGGSGSTELASATIEEIVRRVVAQMSESVVREVAWEVVPDCVERVIDQLTRESLSKRL
jgi:hypothetical protein